MKAFRVLLVVALGFVAGLPVRSNAQNPERGGAVFLMTNAANRNQVIAYERNADGSLQEGQTFSTGGQGSGGVTDPLGSQGSLTLTQDHRFLLAVNAGSNDVSVFRVFGATLSLVDRVPSGGTMPVAVAQQGNLVYVVNAGGTSNVSGFYLHWRGYLRPIPNSTALLSTASPGAASLSFDPRGQTLLVTEKTTNNIDAFPIRFNGTLGPISITPSVGPGLFGVLFAPSGVAVTTQTGPAGAQTASAVSSYAVHRNETLNAISPDVPTDANATCWHAVTPDGRFVYTSNPRSTSISGFAISFQGALTPIAGTVVGSLPAGSVNLDTAVSSDGRFLYTLNSGTGTVGIFGINQDGTLTSLGEAGGLTANAGYNGIAAN